MTRCFLEGTKDVNNTFLRNGRKYWAVDVALYLKRLEFSSEILSVVSLEIILYYILSLFVFCAMFPLETLPPPGDPSGGAVYLRIVLSPEQVSRMRVFLSV